MTVAERLAAWAMPLRAEAIPPAVTRAAGRHLLDGVGTALAAVRTQAAGPAVTVARGLGGPPEARILGDRTRIGAVAAAFGTGALVHALDLDDTHAGGLVHASAIVVPTVLAVGQQVGASGPEALLAAVIGYEVMCRLGAASPHGFHSRGLHATSVCGPVAAAVVTARLLGLSPEVTTNAIGIAGSSAGGLLEFLHTGSSTKQLHPGAAAAAGVTAARLAAAGATGPSSVLEGDYGLYAALSGRPADPASVVDGLGTRWETTQITVKPYPNCQLLHATLDAARTLDVVTVADIASVTAAVHPDAVDIVCEPRAGKLAPRSPYEAKFSLPWTLAAYLLDGTVGVDTYGPASVARADVRELAARVEVRVVPGTGPAADAPGEVTVETVDGRTLVAAVPSSTGGPARPLTDEALVAKFTQAVGDLATARRLAPLLLDLTTSPTLERVLDLCTGDTP